MRVPRQRHNRIHLLRLNVWALFEVAPSKVQLSKCSPCSSISASFRSTSQSSWNWAGCGTIPGTCHHCFLPMQMVDIVFHRKNFTEGCVGKDFLKFFGLAACKFKLVKDEKWLCDRDTRGRLNLWNFNTSCLQSSMLYKLITCTCM